MEPNPYAFDTSVTFPACAGKAPEASRDRSSGRRSIASSAKFDILFVCPHHSESDRIGSFSTRTIAMNPRTFMFNANGIQQNSGSIPSELSGADAFGRTNFLNCRELYGRIK